MICVGVFLQEGKRGRVELGIKQIAKRCAFFFLFFFTCSLAQFVHRAPEHMPSFLPSGYAAAAAAIREDGFQWKKEDTATKRQLVIVKLPTLRWGGYNQVPTLLASANKFVEQLTLLLFAFPLLKNSSTDHHCPVKEVWSSLVFSFFLLHSLFSLIKSSGNEISRRRRR